MSNKLLQLAARTSSGFFIVLIVVVSRLLGLLEPLELFYLDLVLSKSRINNRKIVQFMQCKYKMAHNSIFKKPVDVYKYSILPLEKHSNFLYYI